MFTSTDKLFFSNDKGATFNEISLPASINKIGVSDLDFHPTEPDWLLFVGANESGAKVKSTRAFYSVNNGKNWSKQFDEYVQKCLFAQDAKFLTVKKTSVYCTAYKVIVLFSNLSSVVEIWRPKYFLWGKSYSIRKCSWVV